MRAMKPSAPKINGLKFGNYTFRLSSSGIIISKSFDDRHLTVCFHRDSILNIHFTNQNTNQQTKIIRVDLEDPKLNLRNKLLNAGQEFLKIIKVYRPGWLYHRQYGLYIVDENDFKKEFLAHSTINKRRLEPNFFKMFEDMANNSGEHIYDPHLLHYLIVTRFVVAIHRRARKCKLLFRSPQGLWQGISINKFEYIIQIFKDVFIDAFKDIIESKDIYNFFELNSKLVSTFHNQNTNLLLRDG